MVTTDPLQTVPLQTVPLQTVPHDQLLLGLGFLYERLVDVLDSRGSSLAGVVVEPSKSGLDAAVGPLIPDPVAVQMRRPDMARLREQLTPIVAGGVPQVDTAFQQRLGELRDALEDVYGQRLTFDGEQRETTGTKVAVRQEIDTVQGLVVGADIDSDWANDTNDTVTVSQKARVVEKAGTAIGARLGGKRRGTQL
jgi:hypothetical protein